MVVKILYDLEAQRQIHRAKCFFDTLNKGEAFLNDFENQMELLMQMPEAFQIRYRDVRIIAFEHFSYTVHYVYKNDLVTVLALLNQHQNF